MSQAKGGTTYASSDEKRTGTQAANAGRPGVSRRMTRRRVRAERDSLALVLGLIRTRKAGTRQEIEGESGLGRGVVADRLATLIRSGLIEEGELAASTGGRAPRQVEFRATAGNVLVASLGTTTLGVGLADLAGRLLVEHHEAADTTLGAEKTLDRVEALFELLLEEHPVARSAWSIGLAVPGPVELADGRLSSEPTVHLLPGWDHYPIRERLQRRFGVPVWVGNEAHMMALGELRAGRGAGKDDLLFLKLGTGISAGLYANGQVHRGSQGYAGDIGHVAVSDDSRAICRCGNRGCLEALAGGEAIGREGALAAAERRSPILAELAASGRTISAADVGMAAHLGDPFSVELLSRSGQLIGGAVATLVAAYNPSLIVVGGGVAQAGEILISAIREAVYRRSRSLATENLRIVRSEMGKTAGLVGAALAASDELFAHANLRSWIEQGSPIRAGHAPTRTSTSRSRFLKAPGPRRADRVTTPAGIGGAGS